MYVAILWSSKLKELGNDDPVKLIREVASDISEVVELHCMEWHIFKKQKSFITYEILMYMYCLIA
uniref:Uncharacterized protein n=1 Tax=Heterorhabditis bacteriophora TaxID=37862 RepID=A0A1I7WNT4_HETBA